MKKLVAIVLTTMLVLSAGIGMFAVSADFVPSVEFKDAPEIVPPADATEDVVAIVTGANNEKVNVVDADLNIYSLSDAMEYVAAEDSKDPADADHYALCNNLISAYNNVVSNGVKNAIANIDAAAKALGFTNPKYEVQSMFELSLEGEGKDKLAEEGAHIAVGFENASKVAAGELMVAHLFEDAWKLVDADKVKVDGDVITVSFDGLCPVMLISVEEAADIGGDDETDTTVDETDNVEDPTEEATTPADDETPAATEGGNATLVIVIVCVVVVLAACAATFVVLQKKGVIAKWFNKSGK